MTCVSDRAGQRKCHNDEAGYVAQKDHPFFEGDHMVIYLAAEQGLDTSDGRYAVVCETHGTIVNTTNLPDARGFMSYPEFCEECMNREGGY